MGLGTRSAPIGLGGLTTTTMAVVAQRNARKLRKILMQLSARERRKVLSERPGPRQHARVAALEARLARHAAEKKAMKMRMTEAGGFAAATLGGGFLDSKVPITFMDGAINWGHLFLATGAVLLFFSKGTAQEFGSGLLYGGAAPVLRDLGTKIAERVG